MAKAKAKAKINVKPMGDRVLVRPLEEEEAKVGSLYVPDTAKERPQQGEIVALGTGRVLDDGTRVDFEVAVGDRVLYGKYSGSEVRVGEDEYLMMHESDILAVIQ